MTIVRGKLFVTKPLSKRKAASKVRAFLEKVEGLPSDKTVQLTAVANALGSLSELAKISKSKSVPELVASPEPRTPTAKSPKVGKEKKDKSHKKEKSTAKKRKHDE
mmetsp:Transcript_29044/g.55743  ORF Transcript_29044/g.55743 Transcript_29044/m.55743 type:complete len:106 (+) Transcript_29044:56-373(+)